MFAKISIKPHDEINDFAWPLKTSKNKAFLNAKVYGGYTDLSFGYYSLFESIDKKNEKYYTLCAIPTILKTDKDILNYVTSRYKLVNPSKVIDKLKINTVLRCESSKFCITGKTNAHYVIKNLLQSFFSFDEQKVIKKIAKLNNFVNRNKGIDLKTGLLKDDFIAKYNINSSTSEFIISKSKLGDGQFVNRSELEYFFDKLCLHFKNNIFAFYTCFSLINNMLNSEEVKNKLASLNLFAYSFLLGELLNLIQCRRFTANLELIGGSPASGTLLCPAKLPKNIKVIYESITGFYSKIVWENK